MSKRSRLTLIRTSGLNPSANVRLVVFSDYPGCWRSGAEERAFVDDSGFDARYRRGDHGNVRLVN